MLMVGGPVDERAQQHHLVANALVMVFARSDPDGDLVRHGDRGPPCTSLKFTKRLADENLNAFYGSMGGAFDNAAMESFWATLRREVIHILGNWEQFTRSELRTILVDYIEVFDNRQRHQARLNHHTPAETYAASTA